MPTTWVKIEPRLCQCGCGTIITKKEKRSQGRFCQGHTFKSAINRAPNPSALTEEEYARIRKIPAWRAVYESVEGILWESFNGYEVVNYGTLEELDDLIY